MLPFFSCLKVTAKLRHRTRKPFGRWTPLKTNVSWGLCHNITRSAPLTVTTPSTCMHPSIHEEAGCAGFSRKTKKVGVGFSRSKKKTWQLGKNEMYIVFFLRLTVFSHCGSVNLVGTVISAAIFLMSVLVRHPDAWLTCAVWRHLGRLPRRKRTSIWRRRSTTWRGNRRWWRRRCRIWRRPPSWWTKWPPRLRKSSTTSSEWKKKFAEVYIVFLPHSNQTFNTDVEARVSDQIRSIFLAVAFGENYANLSMCQQWL